MIHVNQILARILILNYDMVDHLPNVGSHHEHFHICKTIRFFREMFSLVIQETFCSAYFYWLQSLSILENWHECETHTICLTHMPSGMSWLLALPFFFVGNYKIFWHEKEPRWLGSPTGELRIICTRKIPINFIARVILQTCTFVPVHNHGWHSHLLYLFIRCNYTNQRLFLCTCNAKMIEIVSKRSCNPKHVKDVGALLQTLKLFH